MAHRLPPTRRPPVRLRGFSLVEVTLALGIVSFALIAIFGLVPSGLSTFRTSIDRTVASQIAQNIVNQARQTDFNNLTSLATPPGSPRRFTEDGDEITNSIDYSKTIYIAKVEVTNSVTFPDSPANTNMMQIRVRVANSPAGNEAVISSPATIVQDFSAFIPKK